MAEWYVPFTAMFRGEAWIEADTADEAEEKVRAGAFDVENTSEMVDWEVTGRAKECK